MTVNPEMRRAPQGRCQGRLTQARNCLLDVAMTPPDWSEDRDLRRLAPRTAISWSSIRGCSRRSVPAEQFLRGIFARATRSASTLGGWLTPMWNLVIEMSCSCEETPSDRFDELGGLDTQILEIKRFLDFRLQHAEWRRALSAADEAGGLVPRAPGNGKTKFARAIANYLAEISGDGVCRFMAVSGSSDYSMWLGQSEQKH